MLLPPAVPELPPGRSFSFSPLEDAAMLLTGTQPASAQLCTGEERRVQEAEGSVTEEGQRGPVTAPPRGLEVHCGRLRHLLGQRGLLRANPNWQAGQVLLHLPFCKSEWEASAQRILSV